MLKQESGRASDSKWNNQWNQLINKILEAANTKENCGTTKITNTN